MKFKGRILILLSSFFFLCSFTNNSGSIYVEWHAFTSYVSIDENGNRSEEKSGAGHSFVVFKNNTNRSMTIGYKTISPGEYLSVGFWNGVSAGTSSSGSSDSQSSSGSSNASSCSHTGVYYDLERYYYTRFENMRNDVYATCTFSSDEKLNSLTQLLKDKNDTYNLAFYNCANLSTHIWNTINGTNYYGFIESPSSNRKQIMKENPYYSGNDSLTSSTNFQYYSTSKKSLVSCTLHY